MIGVAGRKGDCGPNILGFQIGEVLQNLLQRCTLGEHFQDILDSDTHPPDAGTPPALGRIQGNSVEGWHTLSLLLPAAPVNRVGGYQRQGMGNREEIKFHAKDATDAKEGWD